MCVVVTGVCVRMVLLRRLRMVLRMLLLRVVVLLRLLLRGNDGYAATLLR